MRKLIFVLVLLGVVSGCGPPLKRVSNEFTYKEELTDFKLNIDEKFSFQGQGFLYSGFERLEADVFIKDSKHAVFVIVMNGLHMPDHDESINVISKKCLDFNKIGSCYTYFHKPSCTLNQATRHFLDSSVTLVTDFVQAVEKTDFLCTWWDRPEDEFSPEQKDFLKKFQEEGERVITVKIEPRR
ncbi:hypothetical protein [Maridesulfovibrio ferrireducens]|uniref:hypothetical protein n=1 Tax=Maridesulfovibrio ferrireducens TaxID=246191 RepID=UPI001A327C83|nr:hypothetical protein [Maridesulfovibrio ferrireducens]MBI9109986.1 hypothetical protein [Maridesulfovibrio ferrireducens]